MSISARTIIISFLAMTLIMVGAAVVITGSQPAPPAVASYVSQEKDRPKIEVKNKYINVGQIKVSDVITRDFPIKNVGNKPVQLLNINSSCGCTSGKIIYQDFTSKEYGMHAQSEYITEIAPGDTATLKLTYRPSTMPVYGAVEREVYVSTNDPDNAKLIFAIKAVVK